MSAHSSFFVRMMRRLARFVAIIMLIVIGSWLTKAYFISIYYIPSGSMEPTLSRGDYVLVTKFPYNLRSPEYYPLTDSPFPYVSFSGLGKVQRGDIVVFDLPLGKAGTHPTQKTNYIKRITGMPGDSVAIINNRYVLKRTSNSLTPIWQSSKGHTIIPKKGAACSGKKDDAPFWSTLRRRDGSMQAAMPNLLHSKTVKTVPYHLQQPFYFVEGDNRRLSADSRSWGLLSASHLMGQAVVKLWLWPPTLLH